MINDVINPEIHQPHELMQNHCVCNGGRLDAVNPRYLHVLNLRILLLAQIYL